MNDITFIRNKDINIKVKPGYFRNIYEEHKRISFELTEIQANTVKQLSRSFGEERKKKNFDKEKWVKACSSKGLYDDIITLLVFGFVVANWDPTTHISTENTVSYVVFHFTKKGTLQ